MYYIRTRYLNVKNRKRSELKWQIRIPTDLASEMSGTEPWTYNFINDVYTAMESVKFQARTISVGNLECFPFKAVNVKINRLYYLVLTPKIA